MYKKALWIVSALSFIAVMSTATVRANDSGKKVAVPASTVEATTVPAVSTGRGNSSALAVAEPPPLPQSTRQPVSPTAGLIPETTLLGVTCVGIAGVLFLFRRRRTPPLL